MAGTSGADPRRRRGLPDWLLLPPAPRQEALARRWRQLAFEQRRALALASTRPSHRAHTATVVDDDPLGADDVALVRALAQARIATGWRLQVAALVFGWLMLMTLWGFGRSTFPEHEGAWLVAGLVAGALVWLGAALAATRRVRRARTLADLPTDDE